MHVDLSNQRILVTGASRGIGRAIAKQLSESGAEVLIHFNKNSEAAKGLQEMLPSSSHLVQMDLADLSQVVGWMPLLVKTYGKIDAVVNNAGVAISIPDNADSAEWLNIWRNTMDVNATALAIICKEFLKHACENKSGRIVNISSRAAFRGDTPDFLAYAASKGAIVSLTRSIARHYGKQGVKAFVIAPGFTRTDMAQEIFDQYGEEFGLGDIALSQLTEPKDISPTVAFLCSGLADHATGCTIDINAGSYVR